MTGGRTVTAVFTYGANETISAAALEVMSRSGVVEVKRLGMWSLCVCELKVYCNTAEERNISWH